MNPPTLGTFNYDRDTLRPSLGADWEALGQDRERGLSLPELAELHHVSKSTVSRALHPARRAVPNPLCNPLPKLP